MPLKRCTSYQGGVLCSSVVCVTECYSCGPPVNPFIFKKQMGHARLEINYGQISDLETIGQKLDNQYNDYQPDVECTLFCCFSLTRFYPRSNLGSSAYLGYASRRGSRATEGRLWVPEEQKRKWGLNAI